MNVKLKYNNAQRISYEHGVVWGKKLFQRCLDGDKNELLQMQSQDNSRAFSRGVSVGVLSAYNDFLRGKHGKKKE